MNARGAAGFATVAVPVPVRRLFTYSVDEDQGPRLQCGVRVRVPFGRRKVEGTVVEWPAAQPGSDVDVKPIDAVLSDPRRLPPSILELTRFVADYYLCSWGEAIETALPPPDPGAARVRRMIRATPRAELSRLPARASGRRALVEALVASREPLPVDTLDPKARRAVPALRELGWVEILEVAREIDLPSTGATGEPEPGPTPSAAQAAVLGQLDATLAQGGGYRTFLLHGATGSGKTEVYFRAAQRVLDTGRSVLYLVPEIGLTPLLLSKVARRFPDGVGVLHSGLGRRERYAAWSGARDGRCRLIIGTRSAIFAPLNDLGLIVVDEEQDGSYKQEESPRYNARDLAIVRARAAGAAVLLGSATPSMESFYRASHEHYGMLRLGGRIEQRPLPEVRLVDMRTEFGNAGAVQAISRELGERLRACVERGEQAMVLRNRRGWAAAVFCPTCGKRVSCDRCSISLTWHRADRRLRCHYCALEQRFPDACPTCGGEELKLLGEGTERIEDELRATVPDAVVERMDRDTIRRRGAHERILRKFDRGEIDVLVGTQMIAKGHDFHRVTLVGVLNADQALGMPDFRAGERVFQLLTQVAGRAGRGDRPGTVVVQAFDVEHPLLSQAARQDYEAFYESEIRYRRALRYPPLVGLVQLIVRDREAHRASDWAERLTTAIRRAGEGRLVVSGPGPAPIERLRGLYRQQILVRTAGRRRLIAAVERALQDVEGQVPRRAVQVDVDPYSLL